jgi:hypothetical protein
MGSKNVDNIPKSNGFEHQGFQWGLPIYLDGFWKIPLRVVFNLGVAPL